MAVLLIALGIAAFGYAGYTSQSHVPLPPLAGALAIGVGIILLFVDVKTLALTGARS